MTIRIGIHGQPAAVELLAAAEGVAALGGRALWRSVSDYRAGEVESIFDAVVISGTRARGALVAADYTRAGIPVLVLDYGYLRRVHRKADWLTGHWQFGLGGLNWIPWADLPDDRLRRLEVALSPRRAGKRILVCGQHAGDPSHGLDAAGVAAWARSTVAELRELTARPIVWRPHPDSPQIAAPEADDVSTEPLADALEDAHAIVTISSNSGHEALLAGVPVFCALGALYAHLANVGLAAIEEPFFPEPDALWNHLARLAYAQWTLDEIRTGEPIRFLLDAAADRWPEAEAPLAPVMAAAPPRAAAQQATGHGRPRGRAKRRAA
jgi:hypothetical protein